MRSLFLLPFIGLFNFSKPFLVSQNSYSDTDTVLIKHVQDGSVNEWPDSLFQTDKGTNISHAADNDDQNLYIAIKIPDFPMQMKMMRMGMNLYIDLKGKKKENRGIEFPIKRESEGGFSNGNFNQQNQQQDGNQQRGLWKKRISG